MALGDIEQQIQEQEMTPPKRRKPREGLSDKLPRIRVDLPLSEVEKARANHSFFSKVKEELDIIPAKAREIEYWQEDELDLQPEVMAYCRGLYCVFVFDTVAKLREKV